MKPFKTKKQEIAYRKETCLTTGKLIEFLQKFPEDTLIYFREGNTCTWQEVPYVGFLIKTSRDEMKEFKENVEQWYKGSVNKKQLIDREVKETFKYMIDKKSLCIEPL